MDKLKTLRERYEAARTDAETRYQHGAQLIAEGQQAQAQAQLDYTKATGALEALEALAEDGG